MPIGPFQNTVRASMMTSLNAAAEPGPMSKPLAPSGRRVPNVAKLPLGVDADDVLGKVDGLAAGRRLAASRRLQVSTWSGSNSESPIG